MRLVAERQSDPVAVRGTRLAEKGSHANVRIPCRGESHSDDEDQADGVEEELDELCDMFAKIQASLWQHTETWRRPKVGASLQTRKGAAPLQLVSEVGCHRPFIKENWLNYSEMRALTRIRIHVANGGINT